MAVSVSSFAAALLAAAMRMRALSRFTGDLVLVDHARNPS